jgi:hypothetical protein
MSIVSQNESLKQLRNEVNMKNSKKNSEGKGQYNYMPTKFMLTIRILVGGYLIYTAYELIKGIRSRTGWDRYVIGAFMIAFTITGIGLIIVSFRNMLKGKYIGGTMDYNKENTSDELPYHKAADGSKEESKTAEIMESDKTNNKSK